MGFIYDLALVLVIFEGIIIQCEGTGGIGQGSGANGQGSNDDEGKPKELCQTDLAKRKFENYTFLISSCDESNGKSYEYCTDGVKFLKFGDYHTIIDFFNRRLGLEDKPKKIHIDLDGISDRYRKYFVFNIIKEYKNDLEELRITTLNHDKYWEEILDEEISFPKMKNFQFRGKSNQYEFKLMPKFPNLVSLMLVGDVTYVEHAVGCLAHMKKLKYLTLHTKWIKGDQLKEIWKDDPVMSKITILSENTETMDWIKENEELFR